MHTQIRTQMGRCMSTQDGGKCCSSWVRSSITHICDVMYTARDIHATYQQCHVHKQRRTSCHVHRQKHMSCHVYKQKHSCHLSAMFFTDLYGGQHHSSWVRISVYKRDMAHSYVLQHSFICVTWLPVPSPFEGAGNTVLDWGSCSLVLSQMCNMTYQCEPNLRISMFDLRTHEEKFHE